MQPTAFFDASRLTTREGVPLWYSLAPHNRSFGLALTLHRETWHQTRSFLGESIRLQHLQEISSENNWLTLAIPFSRNTLDQKSLQQTLANLFQGIESVEKYIHPKRYQLAACGILFSHDDRPKGYLMNAYISNDLKRLLVKDQKGEAAKLARKALRDAAARLHFPVMPDEMTASAPDGFLHFILRDGSGSILAADYRDKEEPDNPYGYTMTSDNIDSPALQLIFLYALATVAEWGRQQLV